MWVAAGCLWSLWTGAVLFAAPSPPEEGRLSLKDANQYAISHNFRVQSLQEQLEASRGALQAARSNYYPRLGIAGGAEREVIGNQSQGAALGYGFVNWNLFRGFRDRYGVDQAALGVDRAQLALDRSKLEVSLDVETAFYNYLFLKVSKNLNEEALTLNKTHKRLALRRQRTGMASQSDIMEFDLREAILRSDSAALEQEQEVARVNLKRLLGEQVGKQIEPIGLLKHHHLEGSLQSYAEQLKGTSQPIRTASLDLAVSRSKAKSWLGEWFPQVDLEARAGYLPLIDRGNQPNSAGWTVTVEARWEFFSGLGTQGRRKEQIAQAAQAEAHLKQTILDGITEVETAFRRIKVIEERVHLEAENRERAEKYYSSVMKEYQRGVRNSADVRQAATGLLETRQRLEKFKFDFIQERIALERALGMRVETVVRPEGDPH